MSNKSVLLVVGLFVIAACSSSEGSPSSTGSAAAGAASPAPGGSAGMHTSGGAGGTSGAASGGQVEGGPCSLSGSQCDPDCGASCGSDPKCLDLCCHDTTSTGFYCNGSCQANCKFHDETATECTSATPVRNVDGSCAIDATVKGRRYHIEAHGFAGPNSSGGAPGAGAFETYVCKRQDVTISSAGYGNCPTSGCCKTGTCVDLCAALAEDWSSCCGT